MPFTEAGAERLAGFSHTANGIVREMTVAADEAYRTRVDAALADFAAGKRVELTEVSADLGDFVDAAAAAVECVRTNLDVLNVQQNVFTTRRDLADAYFKYLIGTLRLKAAVGTLSEQDVEDMNRQLKG